MPVEIKKAAIGVCNRYVVCWFLFLCCLSWIHVPVSAATEEQAASFSRAVALSKSSIVSEQAEARFIFAGLSAQGISEAKFNLGTLLAEGKGGSVDYVMAKTLFEEIADKGFTRAYFNLGLFHEKGRGGPVDPAQAAKCYEKAAQAGVVEAKFNLGGMYAEGRGVKRDDIKARGYFKSAGESGFAAGYYEFALLCSKDFKIIEEDFEARWALERAADAGHGGAAYFLYRYVEEGGKGISSSAAYYKTRASLSGAEGHLQVALLLLEGRHCRRDLVQGMAWLRKAAEMKLPEAKLMLARHLIKGDGAGKNLNEAVGLLKDDALRANAEALYLRGIAELEVSTTPAATEMALGFLKHASDAGFHDAHLCVALRLKAQENPDIRQVIMYLRRGAVHSNDAKYELASLLLDGPYQFRDVDFALLVLGELANSRHGRSAYRLYLFHSGDTSAKVLKAKAAAYLGLAVSSGYYPAYADQAKVRFEQHLKGDPTGAGDAQALLKKAADKCEPSAMRMLSAYYLDARYGSIDKAQAYRWGVLSELFSKQDKPQLSEDFDHLIPAAQREEGEYLARKTYDLWISDGLIVENPEMTEALKNARARDANAQLKIARAYELGKEIPRNLTRALSWYLVAARHGSKEAEAAGSALRRRLTSFQITDAEMASYELLK